MGAALPDYPVPARERAVRFCMCAQRRPIPRRERKSDRINLPEEVHEPERECC